MLGSVWLALPYLDPRWAFPAFALLVIAAFWAVSNLLISRIRYKDEMELAQREAERLRQLDQEKTRFFTNITHELRTPLTLIRGHLDLLAGQMTDAAMAAQVATAQRNAKELTDLVDRLLETARLEAGGITANLRPGDLASRVKHTAESFRDHAHQRGLAFGFEDQGSIMADFDPEKIDMIVSNLVSNAFKYTQQGRVLVRVNRLAPNKACIEVEDTGIGIPKHAQAHVFDRFYKVGNPQDNTSTGSGIGLALVKELVALHKGEVRLESEEGKGTKVKVELPCRAPETAPTAQFDEENDTRPVVLLVEDHADIRHFVNLVLGGGFHLEQAVDGEAGLAAAQKLIPDLIITDLMMPGMDGLEMTKRLKTDERTSHIPVVMLTAKTGTSQRVEGLATGADAYLTKPFSPDELTTVVQNLIDLRTKLKQRYSRSVLATAPVVDEPSMDDRFLERVRNCLHRHLDDENYSVEQLSSDVGLSRAQLHRKLVALTDRSATRFMRAYRMEHAYALLKANVGTVSEVAYRVGYSNPAYFTRCFTEDFGVPPSKVREG